MEALDTRKMETDENSSGALGAGEHGGGSHQLQSPGSNPPTLTLAEFLLEIQRICASFGKSVCHFLTGGSGAGFEKEWIFLKKGFFAL